MRISDWSSDVCSSDLATISEIQGSGATTPLDGVPVTTTGVVTAAYPAGGFYGFYIQEPGSGAADLDLSSAPAARGVFVRQVQSAGGVTVHRSEERRVGKECVSTC